MNIKKFCQTAIDRLIEAKISPSEARVEVGLLVEHVFGFNKKDILLNPDRELQKKDLEQFNSLVKKRVEKRIPVQYLINSADFMDEVFYVDENVLIPRPETELLVEIVLEKAKKNARILDIGAGSGCIAVMLAKRFPRVTASDISEKALEVAKRNARKIGVDVRFIQSDIFENIDEKFDVIVSNPPYIAEKERENLQIEVAGHEPGIALFTNDEEGVAFYRKLAEGAASHLTPEGFLVVEIGFSQANTVREIFETAGFKDVQVLKDLSNIERVVIAHHQP